MARLLSSCEVATTSKKTLQPVEFGALVMEMAEPYGVEAIAIGRLPKIDARFPLRASSPASFAPRVAPGSLSNTTHFFFATDADTGIWHMVCDNVARRDEEIARAGAGVAFVTGGAAQDGETRGAIFFGPGIPQDEPSMRVLSLIASFACVRMLTILLERPAQPLSDRQLAVLSWAAERKTDWEIAAILGLSNFTVDKYMRQIKNTLGCVSRTAAIVKAMRSGMIT